MSIGFANKGLPSGEHRWEPVDHWWQHRRNPHWPCPQPASSRREGYFGWAPAPIVVWNWWRWLMESSMGRYPFLWFDLWIIVVVWNIKDKIDRYFWNADECVITLGSSMGPGFYSPISNKDPTRTIIHWCNIYRFQISGKIWLELIMGKMHLKSHKLFDQNFVSSNRRKKWESLT